MYIEEMKEGDSGIAEDDRTLAVDGEELGFHDAKKVVIGVGARFLFYPTMVYNVVRNKIQLEFRWWDEVDEEHEIKHLVIPTRDYCFAPSFGDICKAVDFIHSNASSGKTTYVHCKAGRGRSTTIVLCYLVQHRQMTPSAAYACQIKKAKSSFGSSQVAGLSAGLQSHAGHKGPRISLLQAGGITMRKQNP